MSTTHASTQRPSGVGLEKVDRDWMGTAMRVVTALTGSRWAGKYRLRKPIERLAYQSTKTGFRTMGAATRAFARVSGGDKPKRLPANESARQDYFDLTPTEDQAMIVATVQEFATEILRPAARAADAAATAPASLLARANELGITVINVHEEFDGVATERGAVTNVLVAEALAQGDMGLALPILAPSGVAVALSQWGTQTQQRTYLPSYTGDNAPQSAVVLSEPHPLFDPMRPRTTATATATGFRLSGVKSLVPAAGDAELFVVGAELQGWPALFIVESDAGGLAVEADPGMGLRAAGLGRLLLEDVTVPAEALLGAGDPETHAENYAEAVRLARLGWAALAAGCGRAMLDYVIAYVKEREAFGEPVAHRQAVAFSVADMAIELDGLRLVTLRGAARAEQGLSVAREAALARKLATDRGMRIGLDGVQLLGGHGYTKEHPVERWYRDLRAVGVAEGVVLV